ncbi:right-handed parallel beta-helix repeat-containing protein [Pseudomonas monteilii]|uniref:right-handed parallel beta-helix repeat-containing protein n=1 Tax=Pseudomonas monteilii TaxID=76759 RepID=UPI001F18B5E5
MSGPNALARSFNGFVTLEPSGKTAGEYRTELPQRLRDTQGVHLSGLEVRNFCIGILINRASGNVTEDNRIVANKGGAGIMLTGDDGAGNPTATTTNNNKVLRNQLIDNGDGLELTRGAAFNLVAENLFRSTAANPEPSQGIEILSAARCRGRCRACCAWSFLAMPKPMAPRRSSILGTCW